MKMPTVDLRTKHLEELKTIELYQGLDNEPGVDENLANDVVEFTDANGMVHTAVFKETASSSSMRLKIEAPDGTTKRHYVNLGYTADQQRYARLSNFQSSTTLTTPDGRTEAVLHTTQHPQAYMTEEKNEIDTLGGGKAQLPSTLIKIPLSDRDAAGQVATFEQALVDDWISRQDASFPMAFADEPHPILEELKVEPEPEDDMSDAELEAALEEWNLA